MTDSLFVTLYDSLSRKLAHDMRSTDTAQSLRIVPAAIPSKKAPIILYESVSKGSAMYAGYYPLNEEAYRIAFPKYGLVRFNMNNIYSTRGRVYTCGLDWRDNVGYLYAVLDLPQPPDDPQTAYHDLFFFMDVLAGSLKLHLAPVKLGWYQVSQRQKGGSEA